MSASVPTPTPRISRVSIQGFRSLADVRIEDLPAVSVLIGANGSGKSNLIHFFEMLSWMLNARRLAEFVGKHGGGSDQLFGGSDATSLMRAGLRVETDQGTNEYGFALAYAQPDGLIFTEEMFRFCPRELPTESPWNLLQVGGREARIVEEAHSPGASATARTARTIVHLLRDCAHYQFHNTSDTSHFKRKRDVQDNSYMRSHGGNLAAVLYRLQQEDVRLYEYICTQIRRVLPVFDTFDIEEEYGKVLLAWRARDTGQRIGAHLTSDGSLRSFALITLLNLPRERLPAVMLFDEPELGLHPSAVNLIARMIRRLGRERQVIVATQSPNFVDAFDLDEVIVADTEGSKSTLTTFKTQEQKWTEWLEEYGVGQLWQKNLLGGRP